MGESVTRGGVGRVSRKRREQMRKRERQEGRTPEAAPDPVGVMTHSPRRTGQGRQEDRREQALSQEMRKSSWKWVESRSHPFSLAFLLTKNNN